MKYNSIFYVTHYFIRYCGNAHDYFRERTERFFVFSSSLTFLHEPCVFEEYRDGVKVWGRNYHWYRGQSIPLQYIFFYLYFLHALCFYIPRRTTVISFHPLFCVGSGFFRMFKRCPTFFWVFDYFSSREGLYRIYNVMADFYVRRLHDVYFLSSVMRAEYLRRLGPPPANFRRGVAELAILTKTYKRAPVQGRLGFIGNLKAGQGVEQAMAALALDPSLSLEIVGVGVHMPLLKDRAHELGIESRVRWHGAILDDEQIAQVTQSWEAGLALYEFGDSLVWCDPGKVKLYWQLGLPVIMTRVSHLANKADAAHALVIVERNPEALLQALPAVRSGQLAAGVSAMQKLYAYDRYYDQAFGWLANA